jgi:hypothetical protein
LVKHSLTNGAEAALWVPCHCNRVSLLYGVRHLAPYKPTHLDTSGHGCRAVACDLVGRTSSRSEARLVTLAESLRDCEPVCRHAHSVTSSAWRRPHFALLPLLRWSRLLTRVTRPAPSANHCDPALFRDMPQPPGIV